MRNANIHIDVNIRQCNIYVNINIHVDVNTHVDANININVNININHFRLQLCLIVFIVLNLLSLVVSASNLCQPTGVLIYGWILDIISCSTRNNDNDIDFISCSNNQKQ